MADIKPFKAVKPTRDKVSLVASRSYQSYTQAELDGRLDYNPFSFLHIYKSTKKISRKERFQLVRNKYLEFKEDGVFVQDKKPNFYIYKIIDRDNIEFKNMKTRFLVVKLFLKTILKLLVLMQNPYS